MSGLAALLAGHSAPGVYQWHSAAHVEDIQHAVEKAGWSFVYLDSWTIEDKQTFLKALAAACDFPDDASEGFEGLERRLAGLARHEADSVVLLWDGWSPLARHDEECFGSALSVLRSRAAADGAGRFAALLRGDGPTIDVPEVPDKHL